MNLQPQDDMEQFLSTLPDCIGQSLKKHDLTNLVELVLDIGRPPEARFFAGAIDVTDEVVTPYLIETITSGLSFGEDNRAGISGTLHRISAIRDRKGDIIGLTCRVGRAIPGAAEIIEDILASGKSVLLLGRPGLGKTTRLRDAARLLSTTYKKRVIIVDTSNEIAGDGTVPHPATGRARRMPVPSPSRQASVMIEAVENHTPEVIIIDEIGDSKDVQAARTIAERGVQLIATAHGSMIGNIIDNPMLSDLLGGCQTVTLGDEEAKRRGGSKSVVERKHSPTFDVVVELVDFENIIIHMDTAAAVDNHLSGCNLLSEGRGPDGIVEITGDADPNYDAYQPKEDKDEVIVADGKLHVYTLGLSRHYIKKALEDFGIPSVIVSKASKATLAIVIAEKADTVCCTCDILPVRKNTLNQITTAIAHLAASL